jgi:hypothetical protein
LNLLAALAPQAYELTPVGVDAPALEDYRGLVALVQCRSTAMPRMSPSGRSHWREEVMARVRAFGVANPDAIAAIEAIGDHAETQAS